MSQPLSEGEGKWLDSTKFNITEIMNLKDTNKRYICEVDLEYPENLHNVHNYLPFCPQHKQLETADIGEGDRRLMLDFSEKSEYVLLDEHLQLCLKHGLKLKKVHRVLCFRQTRWLKPFVDYTIRKKIEANNKFEKEFYKMLYVKLYGKLYENFDRQTNTQVVTNGVKLEEVESRFIRRRIINKNVVLFDNENSNSSPTRCIPAAFCILELSKVLLYKFHYEAMVPKYENKLLKVLHVHTDSIYYKVETEDFFRDTKEDENFSQWFDDQQEGKMKDESAGKKIKEFYSNGAKSYFIDYDCNEKPKISTVTLKKQDEEKLTKDDFESCVFKEQVIEKKFDSLVINDNFEVFAKNENTICLYPGDLKRHILDDKINTLAKGHRDINHTTSNNQKRGLANDSSCSTSGS